MKTFEKYIEEISTILANSHCDNAHLCNICNVRNVCEKLGSLDEKEIKEFLLSEYKEHIKLTKDEKAILRNLSKEYEYIARDGDGSLYIYKSKHRESNRQKSWLPADNGYMISLNLFKDLFQSIKWGYEEPYSIEELLKEN